MDNNNTNTNTRKNKHLNIKERITIELRLKDGFSAYKIAKELNRSKNTILNEIRRGTTTQIKQGKPVEVYLADTGQAVYNKNRANSCCHYKYLECKDFIDYVVDKVINHHWSLDACFGEAMLNYRFKRDEMVCTKTLYNYVDTGLFGIKNSNLPLKLRRNTKTSRVRKHKKVLGNSIEQRPEEIELRQEFGHWEIDTVIGEKSKSDNVLLTLVERKTRYANVIAIPSKSSESVLSTLKNIKEFMGDRFNKVFKTITADNGSEFADLSTLEESKVGVYFTRPFSSYEKGTNERHNGLIRRFIHKGKRIADYDFNQIAAVEEWMNTLPRKILGYKTPEQLFEEELDLIYAV